MGASLVSSVVRAHDEPPDDGAYGAVAVLKLGRDQATSTTHLHANELHVVPARTAEDALRLVPGLIAVQHGTEGKGYQFFLRGFDAMHGADLAVDVEGIPLNEWSNVHAQGYLDLGFLPPELIQQVTVVKGPFELEQGPFAVAGSASYELGVAESERGLRAAYTLGSTGRHRVLATYSPVEGDGSQLVALELMQDQGFGMQREARRASVLGRVHLLDDERGRLSLLVAVHAARFDLPGTVRASDVEMGRLGFYDAYFSEGAGMSARALAALLFEHVAGKHELSARAFAGLRALRLRENFTGDLFDPVNGDLREQRQHAVPFGAAVSYDLRLAPRLRLLGRAGVRGDAFEQKDARVRSDGSPVETRRALEALQLASHLALGMRYRPLRPLRLEAGARLDLFSVALREQHGESGLAWDTRAAISPRARVGIRVSPAVQMVAAYGRGLRPPEARAYREVDARALGLSEEGAAAGRAAITQSHTVELGTRIRLEPVWSFALSAFATYLAREMLFDHVSGLNLELHGTRRLGAELVASAALTSWLALTLDVTGVDARFIESGRRVPLAPWLTSGARLVLTHPSGVHAGLRFVAVAPRPLPHGARGEALYLFDVAAGYRYRNLRLGLAVENVLARRLREGEYHFAAHWYPDEPQSQLPTLQYVAGRPLNARLTLEVVF